MTEAWTNHDCTALAHTTEPESQPKPRAIAITLTNEDENYQFSNWVEPLADTYLGEDASMGDIYRASRDEYGRCRSKVYVDVDGGPPKPVGWFFVSRQRYEDTGESYLRGAWVTVGEYVPATPEHVIL